MREVLTVNESVKNELAVLLDQVVDVTKDTTFTVVSSGQGSHAGQYLPHGELLL